MVVPRESSGSAAGHKQVTGVLLLAAAVALAAVNGACMDPMAAADIQGGYDPSADPAVNPDSLYEQIQEPAHADTEAVIQRYCIDEPTSLNPLFINAWCDGWTQRAMFDRLIYHNQQLEAVWNPAMVESVEELDDRRTQIIRLHPFLKWHDGQPLTAHDVVFTWSAVIDDNVPAISYKHNADAIEEIIALDDHTLRVVHKEATVLGRENLRFWIVPRHLLDIEAERRADPTLKHSEYYNGFLREGVVGNGPYRLVEWISKDRVVLERWDDYPHEHALAKRLVFKIQSDRNSALLLFRKGQLDDLWLTVQQFGSQTEDAAFREVGVKAIGPRWMQGYIGWNMDGSNAFFADRRVRRAMAHAYNRQRILEYVTYNVYYESNGPFDPSHWAHNPSVEPVAFDLERAGQLLDEAGWRIDPDDGWRYRTIDGRKVRFHFQMNLPVTYVDAVRMVELYRDDLRKIGVSFDSRVQENATHVQHNVQHEFEATVGTFQVFLDPDNWRNYFHSAAHRDGRNYWKYESPRVDELFDRSRQEFDRQLRTQQLQELQALVMEDQPVLWLWNYTTTWAFSHRVRGCADVTRWRAELHAGAALVVGAGALSRCPRGIRSRGKQLIDPAVDRSPGLPPIGLAWCECGSNAEPVDE